jgi:hypothetical protein
LWIPTSEREILAAIEVGGLIETASFDAKVALPAKGRSKDIAVDVAAMANDGGTLLYGVGEDEAGRLTIPKPFSLAGARERVDQIVHTCISEPPAIEVYSIPTDDDPGLGYLVVGIPPSPRAPHMVTVERDNRYYGRGATGNMRLSEGDVARLYERRERWGIDRDDMLDEAIDSAPIQPHEDYAFLHLIARPVVPDEELLDKAKEDQHAAQFLDRLFSAALSPEVFSTPFSPDLYDLHNYERSAEGWVASKGLDENEQPYRGPGNVLTFEISLKGGGHLFCGRAAQRDERGLLIFENIVAGLSTRFLAVLGGLYAAGGYLGPVDVGLAVTGLRGGISSVLRQRIGVRSRPFDKDRYRRTERFSATMLKNDPRGAARELALPLAQATTRETYDPFSG